MWCPWVYDSSKATTHSESLHSWCPKELISEPWCNAASMRGKSQSWGILSKRKHSGGIVTGVSLSLGCSQTTPWIWFPGYRLRRPFVRGVLGFTIFRTDLQLRPSRLRLRPCWDGGRWCYRIQCKLKAFGLHEPFPWIQEVPVVGPNQVPDCLRTS